MTHLKKDLSKQLEEIRLDVWEFFPVGMPKLNRNTEVFRNSSPKTRQVFERLVLTLECSVETHRNTVK